MRKHATTDEEVCAGEDRRRQWAVAFLGLVLRRPIDALAAAAALVAFGMVLANTLFLQPNPHPAPLFAVGGKQAPAPARDMTGAVVIPPPRATEATGRSEPVSRSAPVPRAETGARAESEARLVQEHARSQLASDIQRELRRVGLYDGPVDGRFGSKSADALRKFEKQAGLAAKGEPSEAILKLIAQASGGGKSAPAAPVAAVSRQAGASIPPRGALGPVTNSNVALQAEPSAPSAPGEQAALSTKRIKAVQQVLAEFGYGQVKPTGTPDAATRAAIEAFETVHKLPVTGEINDRFLRELVEVTDRPIE